MKPRYKAPHPTDLRNLQSIHFLSAMPTKEAMLSFCDAKWLPAISDNQFFASISNSVGINCLVCSLIRYQTTLILSLLFEFAASDNSLLPISFQLFLCCLYLSDLDFVFISRTVYLIVFRPPTWLLRENTAILRLLVIYRTCGTQKMDGLQIS